MFDVEITASAESDLREIYLYHWQYSAEYAQRYHDGVIEFLYRDLSLNPKLGAIYNDNNGLRRFVYVGRFNIYYLDDSKENKAVYILHILDGRQSFNQKLSEANTALPPFTKTR